MQIPSNIYQAEDEEESSEETHKAVPQSNGTVRKNGKDDSQYKNSKSKPSLKQRTKEQLIQKSSNSSSLQGSIYVKTEEKKAVEGGLNFLSIKISPNTASPNTLFGNPRKLRLSIIRLPSPLVSHWFFFDRMVVLNFRENHNEKSSICPRTDIDTCNKLTYFNVGKVKHFTISVH